MVFYFTDNLWHFWFLHCDYYYCQSGHSLFVVYNSNSFDCVNSFWFLEWISQQMCIMCTCKGLICTQPFTMKHTWTKAIHKDGIWPKNDAMLCEQCSDGVGIVSMCTYEIATLYALHWLLSASCCVCFYTLLECPVSNVVKMFRGYWSLNCVLHPII